MIKLSEYLGFIFIEITNARLMADQESARIAEIYSLNPLLQKFSVPRFRIPEMELNIPVVIAGAKFSLSIEFQEGVDQFNRNILNEINIAIKKIQIKKSNLSFDVSLIKDGLFKSITVAPIRVSSDAARKTGKQSARPMDNPVDSDILEFYNTLNSNPNAGRTEEIVTIQYAKIFTKRFEEKGLLKDYKEQYPKNELFLDSVKIVQAYIESRTIVVKNKLENLLVSPETNVIRAEASDLSIFNIKAKINEEGIFVKAIRDEADHVIKADVDFE